MVKIVRATGNVKIEKSNMDMGIIDNSNSLFKRSYMTMFGEKYILSLSKFELMLGRILIPWEYKKYCQRHDKFNEYIKKTTQEIKDYAREHEHQSLDNKNVTE